MLAAAILFVLVVLSAIFLEVILRIDVARREDICQATRNKNKKLEEELGNLRKDNVVLNEDCEDTVALFDMTKDICSSLDEDRLFGVFKERVSRYVSIDDCCLLKKEEDVKKFPGYELFPLTVNNNTVGYLAAKGIKGDSEEKFHILAHQFILGLKRALL